MAGATGKALNVKVQMNTRNAEKALGKLERKINRINNAMNRSVNASFKANNAMTNHCKKTEKSVDSLTKKLGKLAKAYLGVMGARAVLTTADTITSAENRLNNLPSGTQKSTQNSMDKMYTASQNSRMNYTDMMSNVSKSMTLADKAFQGNIDNAIRFQEIMAKSYTLGGASAAEQSSSMYQLIQALGSGILQGDELRSVREGAPIAYKEIEKFAQGLYNTTESLKDLASEGKITSDIVVAAMMKAGKGIDEAFENTDMTFAQAFTNIRNTAIKAFEPVLQRLNDALNSDAGKAIVNGIGQALIFVAGVIQTVFNLISSVYNFVADNWSVISKVLMTIASIMAVILLPKFIAWIQYLVFAVYYYVYLGAVAVASAVKSALAWMMANWQMALLILVIIAVITAIIWLSDSFVDACGIIVGSVFWVQAVIYNVVAFIMNMVIGVITSIILKVDDMGIAIYNAFQGAKASFWEWVSDCLNGTSMVAKAVSKIAEIFGLDGASIDANISAAKSKMKNYHSAEEYAAGYKAYEYRSLDSAYQKGYDIGAKGGQWITDKVSGIGDWISEKLNIANLPLDTSYSATGAYDPAKALDGIGDTADNTGKMADAMELTAEDLEYLRRVADMEWKKEFTTANITVDMSNYNTINGDGDLDGIVTKLTDRLYEELDAVANGVYV